MAGFHRKAVVVIRLDRNFGYSRGESVEFDDQVRGRLRRGVFLLRFLGLLSVLGFVAFFLGNGHFVAFGREGTLYVLAKRDREDTSGSVGRVVEFKRGNLRSELAIAEIVKIVALRIPRRTVGAKRFVGDLVKLAVAGAPNVDRVEAVVVRHAERQIFAARRPRIVAYLSSLRVGYLGQFLVSHRQYVDFAVLVAEGDAFAVRRPLGRIAERLAAGGQLFRLPVTILSNDPHFVLAALV